MTAMTRASLILATFDPQTGDRDVVLRQTDTPEDEDLATVDRRMSSASQIVLSFDYETVSIGGTSFSLVDVASGTVTWDAFTIDPPWFCYGRDCFRDG